MPQNVRSDGHYVPDLGGRRILTVRELRERLAYVDGDMHVLLAISDLPEGEHGEYYNVAEVSCTQRKATNDSGGKG